MSDGYSIAHYTELEKDKAGFRYADFGRAFGLTRLGLSHVMLPPLTRTSLPHAESEEDELVYVIEGTPDVWLNGDLCRLAPGDVVVWKAGTGFGHSVQNNTDTPVRLFVVGDPTIPTNKCAYHINPEKRATSEIWWDDMPVQKLGPDDGLPKLGKVGTAPRPDFVKHYKELIHPDVPSYPGDKEVLSYGARLSDLGLRRIGIWRETLNPGHRTSWPHAHSGEDEFVFVISGTAKVWLDGHIRELGAGMFVAFPGGTGLAHTIINDGTEDVHMIVGGDVSTKADKIFYPLHPLRNEQCRTKGSFWEGHPVRPIGPHNGEPQNPASPITR